MKHDANARFAIAKREEAPYGATGDLQGLLGEGNSAVGHGMEHPFTMSYESS